jgi:hypothetical protein
MRIGVIGSGNLGGTVGVLWARAGHEVRFSARRPERLDALVARAGAHASRGTVEEAARFGDVVLLAVPFGALAALGPTLAPLLHDKVVLEASNPYPARDGAVAEEALRSGRGAALAVAGWLPGVRLVRAFNSVWDRTLAREAHRLSPRVGVPLASDDPHALDVAAALVRDAGFDPVVAGRLEHARWFDVGTPVYNTAMPGDELRRALGLDAPA